MIFEDGSLPDALAAWNREHPDSFWGLQGEALHVGGLNLFDRTTESLWQQFTGEGIVGDLAQVVPAITEEVKKISS